MWGIEELGTGNWMGAECTGRHPELPPPGATGTKRSSGMRMRMDRFSSRSVSSAQTAHPSGNQPAGAKYWARPGKASCKGIGNEYSTTSLTHPSSTRNDSIFRQDFAFGAPA